MKKVLFGFLCMAVWLFTSVSFASNGPETTKECVVDIVDVMETSNNIDQQFAASYDEVTVYNQKATISIYTDISDVILFIEVNIEGVYHIDYGVTLASYLIKLKLELVDYIYILNRMIQIV